MFIMQGVCVALNYHNNGIDAQFQLQMDGVAHPDVAMSAMQGFYVALDYHPYGIDSEFQLQMDGAAYGTPAKFGKKWAGLVQQLQALPVWDQYLKGRVMLDLANELDILNGQWDAYGTKRFNAQTALPPVRDLMNAAINAVYAISPETIMWVGGAGQTQDKCNNWGDGYRTTGTTGSSAVSWFTSVNPNAPVVLAPHHYCEFSYFCSQAELENR